MISINPEYEKIVPPASKEEYQQLKESILQNGMHFPIIINESNIVLDGHHRFRVCKELGLNPKTITKTFQNKLLEKKFVIESNLRRRQLNDFQKAELGIPLLQIEKALAKERQGKRTDLTSVSNDTQVRASAQVSKQIGVSTTTFERAKKVIELATPELKERVRSGQTSINYAYKKVNRVEKKTNAEPIPTGKYSVILADPPWQYDINTRGSPDDHYDVMSNNDIEKLKVPSSADAVLFLWVTAPKLKEAIQVMESWGFTYKTHMVWIKDKIGTGYYFRGQHELLFVGVKGKISIPEEDDRPSSVLSAKRTKHSKKPFEVYDIIEKMYPNQKYLEMFARNTRKNWKSWGNEV